MVSMTDNIERKKIINLENLSRIRNLPAIPTIMMEVSNLLENPNTSASELGRAISRDQAMVAKVLTIANSPLYGLPRKVSTVEFAIVILGFDHIKNIVIALSVMEAFKNKNGKGWNRQQFWMHSLATAVLSKRISEDLGYGKSGEAFTAGLLHDLGISTMQRYFNKEYSMINELADKEQIRYLNAERQVLGIDHCIMGQFLIDNWNLPESLSEAVLYHHAPSEAGSNKVLPSIIHLADFMTQVYRKGDFFWDENMKLDTNIIDILSLGDQTYLSSFIESYSEIFEKHIEHSNTI